MERDRDDVIRALIDMQYDRNEMDFHRGTFRVRGDVLEIIPAYESENAIRVEFFGDEVDRITEVNVLTGEIICGYKYDKKTKTFPVFINYDKQDDISDTTKYEDHFTSYNRLIAISKSGRSIESEDVQNFLNAKERGIDVQLFVRKNKDDKISKEFYYLGRMTSTGVVKEFVIVRENVHL